VFGKTILYSSCQIGALVIADHLWDMERFYEDSLNGNGLGNRDVDGLVIHPDRSEAMN
jgi:hypothetical protein